jgi:hypothetical protein
MAGRTGFNPRVWAWADQVRAGRALIRTREPALPTWLGLALMQLESSGRPEVKAGTPEFYDLRTGNRVKTSGRSKPPGTKGVDWGVRTRYHHWGLYQMGWQRTVALGYPKLTPAIKTPEFYTTDGPKAIVDFWRSVEKDLSITRGDPILTAICWRAGGFWAKKFRDIWDTEGFASARAFLSGASDRNGLAVEYARAADSYACDLLAALQKTYEPRLAGLTPVDDVAIQRALALANAPRSSIALAERAEGAPRGLTTTGEPSAVGPQTVPTTFNGRYLVTSGDALYTVSDGLPRNGLVYDFEKEEWVEDYAGYLRTLLS